jgi:microcystin degradation protein MlrC
VRLKLGGKVDPTMGGAPLDLDAHVVALTDGRFMCYGPMAGGVWRNYGLSALLRVDDVEIIVITHNGQATDLAQFTSLGVDPTRKSTLIVKSMQHFRAAFEPIAREVLEVDTGALSTRNFKERPYRTYAGRFSRSTTSDHDRPSSAGGDKATGGLAMTRQTAGRQGLSNERAGRYRLEERPDLVRL